MAFTCPACSRVSHSPADERQGYCGACREFTGGTVHASAEAMFRYLGNQAPAFTRLAEDPGAPWRCEADFEPTGDFECPECGAHCLVPPSSRGPVLCTCSRPGHLVFMVQAYRVTLREDGTSFYQWSSPDVTVQPQEGGTDNQCLRRTRESSQPQLDENPGKDSMRWLPGCSEL